MKKRYIATFLGGALLGVLATVSFVRIKSGSSFLSTIETKRDMDRANKQFLADYTLSALTSATSLRMLEERGSDAARVALWREAKRIYWDHVNDTPRTEMEVAWGSEFKQFVDSTPALAPLVEKESKRQNKSEMATPRKPSDQF